MFKRLFIYFFLIHTLLLTSSLADRWILVSTSVGDTIKVYIDKSNSAELFKKLIHLR